jgi:hypothetical protein
MAGSKNAVIIEAERTINGKTSMERRYHIASTPPDAAILVNAVSVRWESTTAASWPFPPDDDRATLLGLDNV